MMSTKSKTFAAPDADLILKSSDGVEFHVFRRILIEASRVFLDMFALPSPDSGDTKPVVELSEDYDTLELLLQLVYPRTKPKIDSLSMLSNLAQAADKYMLEGVMQFVRGQIMSDRFVKQSPLRVYAIACRFGFKEEAMVAANHTFNVDMLEDSEADELRFASGDEIMWLLRLRKQRVEVAKALFSAKRGSLECRDCPYIFSHRPSCLWLELLDKVIEEMSARPTTRIISKSEFLSDVVGKSSDCQGCARVVLRSGLAMLGKLIQEFDAKTSTD